MRIKFIQSLLDILRGKHKSISKIIKENDIQISKELLKKVCLNIEGKNNKIVIEDINGKNSKLIINIFGDNNTIIINKGFSLSDKLVLIMGQNHPNFGKITNSSFTIGENTGIESAQYITFNSNTYCNIGKDCMFALDILLHNTDAHPIFDINTNKIINRVDGITIGNHCWIGRGVTVLKNSVIPDNCIVGMNAVYSGKNTKTNSAYAGNPAKLVRENINWDRNGAKCGYIDNIAE